MKVGFFPYGSEKNPYQKLIKTSLESSGVEVVPIYKSKWKILSFFQLLLVDVDIIHFFWPHDFYKGRGKVETFFKRLSFRLSIWVLSLRKLVYSADNLVSHDAVTKQDINDEKKWIQKIIKRAHAVICMSNASLALLKQHYLLPENIVQAVVPHVNYLSEYENSITRKEARVKLKLNERDRVLLSLGRINRYKGIDSQIEAFKIGAQSDSDVLIIVGSCGDHVLIEELNKISMMPGNGRVIINARFIEEEELQYYFKATNGVVLNYTNEPMSPGSLILSMGYGCCIVAPSKVVINELVPKEALFSYEEEEGSLGLSNAIKRFFNCSDIDSLGALCYQKIETFHASKVVGQLLKSTYQEILKQK